MNDGMVIDANIITEFYQELAADTGYILNIVTWVLNTCGIATNDYISNEWDEVCKHDLFRTWYADGLKNGKIRNVESKKFDKHICKKMRIDFGFPITSKDLKYIECANATISTRYIMTYNYHFFEPRCMRQSISMRKKAREERQGEFCKYLRKTFAITVGMPCHCETDFGI